MRPVKRARRDPTLSLFFCSSVTSPKSAGREGPATRCVYEFYFCDFSAALQGLGLRTIKG